MDQPRIAAFCREWRIAKLELFGSVLRDDFGPESDVDVLVSFERGSTWSYLDLVRMENELSEKLGRRVDLVERAAVEASDNYIRRREILRSAEALYAAG
ncbi:MAG: nucleotidyltransferase family protein [Thermoanaerobaculia bacterium]|nr:nucleotidyltransferase family protein [Thermoanaerobaculia bacterium]MBP9825346.1 nucleotidyltransferase family protein [Thermoanaerobaculia bacterium]